MSSRTLILGLETSCDDTAAAVVQNGRIVLSSIVSSQDSFHLRFGGVVPEIASRRHLEVINAVIEEALGKAGISFAELDGLAVAYGPGLVGSLLVGVSMAKALAFTLDLPLMGVNHLEGHIYANFLTGAVLSFPVLSLVVSGGHTSLLYLTGHGKIEVLGQTRDDAAGEVYDKVARALGLGFPGGPIIEKLARQGDRAAFTFPRALLGEEGELDFSFSGLKTAVLNCIHREKEKGHQIISPDIAAAFQKAVVDVLVSKSLRAVKKMKVQQFLLAGGVAANSELRERLRRNLLAEGVELVYPQVEFCTDNGAMIGAAGYYYLRQGRLAGWDLNAVPNLTFESP